MIRALLFDLDETLHDRSGSLPDFLENQYEHFSAHVSPIPLDEYVSVFLELDQDGRVWKDVVYAEMIRRFKLSLPVETLLHDYVTRYPIFARSFTGVTTFFAQLPPELPIGLLSNGRRRFNVPSLTRLDSLLPFRRSESRSKKAYVNRIRRFSYV
ncbi:hypothetical protein [Exiguobacterium acetylicum]|uniref:hypothetical protein n=1 Tax=Exiguobacterium acetylicum TaxID=41170 RepID=UPI001EE307F8|nr:hypothetical protein [Exiguobacterium acetylicum]UKS54622.1 hypothetical protein K6T22_08625 [Exiguobacterium acetylicum]